MSIFTYFYNRYLEFKYRKNKYYIPRIKDYNRIINYFQSNPKEYLNRGLTQSAIKLIASFQAANIIINFKEHRLITKIGVEENAGYIFYVFSDGAERKFKAPEKETYAYLIPSAFKDYCILVNYIDTRRIIKEMEKENHFQSAFFKNVEERIEKEERKTFSAKERKNN